MAKSLYRIETRVLLELLVQLRREAGLTQVQCSKALGRPQSFMSDVERGVRRLDLVQIRDLCKVFGISLPVFVEYFESQLTKEQKYSFRHRQEQQQEQQEQ